MQPNFQLILLVFSSYVGLVEVFGIDPSSNRELNREHPICNFDEDTRNYNATDLLRCMNDLATSIFEEESRNDIIDRSYESSRQTYFGQQYAPNYSVTNYFGNQLLSSLLTNGFRLPNFSNILNFGGFTRPNINLFEALSTISQYDDLKCVPRILCEVASGSMPGSLTYKQNGLQDYFGSNALFGLLTAFDQRGVSPILSFGKAAFLGYANRGDSTICYREYPRCPRNSEQLISYLNNHNGGFFRLFNANRGTYYRPQQSYYNQYYKNSDVDRLPHRQNLENRRQQNILSSEFDRTGTGKLTFDNDNFYTSTTREKKIVFPKEKRENRFHTNRIVKSLNLQDQSILRQDAVNENHYTRKPRYENYVRFPRD